MVFRGKICRSNGRNEQAQLEGCKTKQRNGDTQRKRERSEGDSRGKVGVLSVRESDKSEDYPTQTLTKLTKAKHRGSNPICRDAVAQRKIQTVYLNA